MTPLPDEPAYRFDTFVVGASNRLASSAAMAVADAPGAAYNPLFVYGDSGLGKTHLVAALAHRALAARPELRVELSSGEELAQRLHQAIAAGQQEHFTARYRQVDLLVLDDVQFLAGQRETQSELLRLFNLMQGAGRQLVMTSDRPPREIPDVDQRLLSRLSGGLIVDVGAPDYEMRLAILRNAAEARTVPFGDGVLEEMARLAFGNVRELKGALHKITAFQQLDGTIITPGDVRAVLGERASAVAVPDRAVVAPTTPGEEYEGFLAEVLQEVEARVKTWRVVLGEACSYWRSEGIVTQVLERALAHPVQPDVNGLLATFGAAVEHLRAIEARAVQIDPSLRGHRTFRNPENVAEAQALLDRTIATAVPLPAPNANVTRDSLEEGSANQLALKAFDAVVQHPGSRFNPLFVHGPHGIGKTHVLHALGNALRGAWPHTTIACVSGVAFGDELVQALQEGGVERWRARYRAADVLLLDDVHALRDLERTQDELFHLFNHVYDRGGQIVLTSDRPPRELTGFADRLRSRFEGGLVAAMHGPDRALRERLVTRWLAAADVEPTEALVALLADRDVSSVRALHGLFTRIEAASELDGAPISLESAQRALGMQPTHDTRRAPMRVVSTGTDGVSIDDFFLDREKMILDWPDIGGRVIEELR